MSKTEKSRRWIDLGLVAVVTGVISGGAVYYNQTRTVQDDLNRVKSVLGLSVQEPAVPNLQADRVVPSAVVSEVRQEAMQRLSPEVMSVLTTSALSVVTAQKQVVPASSDPVIEALSLSPELKDVIEEARILKAGQRSQDWAKENMGYVPQGKPGEVIPGMERVKSAPDAWIVGDTESEGGGEVVPNYSSISGKASFTDGGNLVVNGVDIQLSGVLLPQPGASCTTSTDEAYDCQAWAVSGLKKHIEGKTAFCSISETNGVNYGLCDVLMSNDGKAIDLASWIVSAGIGVAYDVPAPSLYHPQEAEAREKKLGLWSGTFGFGGRQDFAN